MPNGIPVIGDIVASSHDKYSENGDAKYDQLLCDGVPFNLQDYPNYGLTGFYEEEEDHQEYLVVVYNGDSSANPGWDFTNTSLPDYDNLFGNTYVVGLGLFEQDRTGQTGTMIVNDTVIFEEGLFLGGGLVTHTNGDSVGTSRTEVVYSLFSGDDLVIKISVDKDINTEVLTPSQTFTLPKEGVSYQGLITIHNGVLTHGFASPDTYLIPEVNLMLVDSLVVSGCEIDAVSGSGSGSYIRRVLYNTTTPTMTSLDPSTPYRIVADLTEDE